MNNRCCYSNCCYPQPKPSCCIPGPMGPQGCTGATGATATNDNAYIYQNASQSVLNNGLVPFQQNAIMGTDITYTSSTVITLAPGTYYIAFKGMVTTSTANTNVGATLQLNSATIPAAIVYYNSVDTTQKLVRIDAIVTVTASSALSIANISGNTLSYNNSSLSIIELA